MTSAEINSLTQNFSKSSVTADVLSFAGRGMKLDKREDAEEIVTAINHCKCLCSLRLEGNTLGVDAARVIGEALEQHPEFERALWSDMFTGRLKTEIPDALRYLGLGITNAGAHLRELDLSDNAFGPNGMMGLVDLLKHPSCFSLQELRLNNNGLGIQGGKMLADSLLKSHEAGVKAGTPLSLRVFVSGRGRLENDGAIALAEAFSAMGSLEEISMPQNGINHDGITALARSFSSNRNLRLINLNDNTFTEKGAISMAKALPDLQQLEVINFGDCLVRTRGAMALAATLKTGQKKLKELILSFGEITTEGAVAITMAVAEKDSLDLLDLDGNQLGEEGVESVRAAATEVNKLAQLAPLDEDQGQPSDVEDNDGEEESDEEVDEEQPEDENVGHRGQEVNEPVLPIQAPQQSQKTNYDLADEISKMKL